MLFDALDVVHRPVPEDDLAFPILIIATIGSVSTSVLVFLRSK